MFETAGFLLSAKKINATCAFNSLEAISEAYLVIGVIGTVSSVHIYKMIS